MPKLTILFALALLAAAPQEKKDEPAPPPAKYCVIVNPKNECKETGDAARAVVKKLYLKQLTKWDDGIEAKPYARADNADEQAAFLAAVLDMGQAELARHWLKMKNTNGTTPPKDVDADRMLMKYVAKYEGAFGVVTIEEAKKSKDVKILFEF